jgi:peptide/nickel transport system substrate-binding protein
MKMTSYLSNLRRAGLTLAAALLLGTATVSLADTSVIRADMGGDIGSLDPVFTTAGVTMLGSFLVYDQLFGLDEANEPQPQMLESYSVSDDALTYTFTLREGLLFHDGTPVTAADAVASWRRWGEKAGRGQMLMGVITDMTVADGRSFTVTLSEPFGQLIPYLASPFQQPFFVMPERLARLSGDEEMPEFVGSGPYRFAADEWVPGSVAVFTAFEGYLPRDEPASGTAGGKVAATPRIEFVVFGDALTSANALVNGEIDLIALPSADVLPILEGAPNVIVTPRDEYGAMGIARLNHTNPPFDNPAIRRAMQHFINQPDIITAITGSPDGGVVCGAILVCGSADASEIGAANLIADLPQAERNALGMAELEAAGYEGEPIVVLHAQDTTIQAASAVVIATNLQEAGVNAILEPMDWATVRERRTVKGPGPDGWHFFLTFGGGLSSADPGLHIAVSTACDDAWFGWPCDAEIEELRKAWVFESDPERRREIGERIQERGMEITVFLPYGQIFQYTARSTSLTGLPEVPENIVLWNAVKSE